MQARDLPGAYRVVVLVSGAGTLLQALLDAPDPGYRVVAVGADRPGATGLDRAQDAGLPTFVERLADHPDRQSWNDALAEAVLGHRPDVVIGAGFMKLVAQTFLDALGCPMLNTHPALLPAFPGAHAVRDALAAGVTTTGATVHEVDAGLDTGPVLAQVEVPVLPSDDEDVLHERIKTEERRLLVETVRSLAASRSGRDNHEVSQ
ncbi:phosphoribosylglycinamide formyltransferase [Pseudonocardia sp. HH130630-07]|uniref:phosphoribosylglycinamide formyltransferase n=1 Tax=Pseudonocardia sp. HH130630-07 TaxID=1690815 RepID=UPI000B2B4DA8